MIAFCPGFMGLSVCSGVWIVDFFYLLAILLIFERKWLGLVAVCGLFIYTHIIGPAFAVAGFIIAIVTYPKEWKKFILLGFTVVITCILWVFQNIEYSIYFSID